MACTALQHDSLSFHFLCFALFFETASDSLALAGLELRDLPAFAS